MEANLSIRTAALLCCIALAGCATGGSKSTSADYKYREAERSILLDEFKRRCVARGGFLYTEGTSRSRIRGVGNRSSRTVCATPRRGRIFS